jgi:hypothetical protein
MGIIGNRGLQGQPILPYAEVKSYAGADVFLDLAFVDHTNTPVVPTSISLEIDDLTNSQVMLAPTVLASGGSTSGSLIYPAFATTMYLQVAGAIMQMSFPYEGSQLCQFAFTFTGVDSVTGQPFTSPAVIAVIELCAIQTVTGGG